MAPSYRFHHLGLVHLPLSREYMSCAFTQKLVKLNRMLLDLGHEVFFYGARGAWDADAYYGSERFHFVETHTLRDIAKDYGDGDNRCEVGYDWTNTDFRHDFNAPRKPSTLKYYGNAIKGILERKRDDDFLLCTQGDYHSPVAEAVGLFLTCEPGVGYRGSVKGRYRAFESAYIQNFIYGSEAPRQSINGAYYDRVIPNYVDPDDVEFSSEKDDYYLFVGRMIQRKGVETAALACNHLGKRLVIAGQGAAVDRNGWLVPITTPDFRLPPGTWTYHGYANLEQRKRLMARAIATFVPTLYLETFGGVHVESMLSGTPPITTNFGVFPGTIPDPLNAVVGFRCNTLQDFVDAARVATKCDPGAVRAYGERFLTGHVKHEFQQWFEDLYQLYRSARMPGEKGWHHLRALEGGG